MLTVAEAAKRATVSEGLIRQWVREGTLPHFRLGAKGKRGKILIQTEDLDGVLANFKVAKKVPEPIQAPAARKSTFQHLKFN
jgi:excisionase family DNA binding protein